MQNDAGRDIPGQHVLKVIKKGYLRGPSRGLILAWAKNESPAGYTKPLLTNISRTSH